MWLTTAACIHCRMTSHLSSEAVWHCVDKDIRDCTKLEVRWNIHGLQNPVCEFNMGAVDIFLMLANNAWIRVCVCVCVLSATEYHPVSGRRQRTPPKRPSEGLSHYVHHIKSPQPKLQ